MGSILIIVLIFLCISAVLFVFARIHFRESRIQRSSVATGSVSDIALNSIDDAVVVLDAQFGYRYANDSAVKLFPGIERLEAGEPVARAERWPKELCNCPIATKIEIEMDNPHIGKRRYVVRTCGIGGKSGMSGWTVVVSDITELSEILEQTRLLANTDPLTGIYNRRYFLESVQRHLEIAKRENSVSSLLFFDIDHFKEVNDTYGHQTGDVVLAAVADAVKKELRPYDIFARYGGEEFALFIINIDCQNALNFAWRLCHSIEETDIRHQGDRIGITASFGIVEVHWDDTLEDAICAADMAMYKAKRNGRNRVESDMAEMYNENCAGEDDP